MPRRQDIYTKGSRLTPFDMPASAPSQYGHFAPQPKVTRVLLDVARVSEKMSLGGSFIWAYRTSDTTANMDIQFNSQQADGINFTLGMSMGGLAFSEVYLTHDAQAGKWIDLFVIREDLDMRALNPANIFTSVTATKATTAESVTDATLNNGANTVLDAADTTRRSAIVQADPGNTVIIRIALETLATAAIGHILQPGESLSFDGTAAINAYAGAAGQKANVTMTKD
jgi:hypothetical protein